MPATEKKMKATKTNYRTECGPLAARIPMLVLVPGMDPDGAIRGYVKQEDDTLLQWGPPWATWRDVFHFLGGYYRGVLDNTDSYEDED